MDDDAVIAYVGLGSNLGDRAGHLRSALDRLTSVGRVVAVSPVLDNPAVGGPDGSPPFLNAVAAVRTDWDPEDLLDALLAIEARGGRVRLERWGPRTIDLDLLLYGDRVIATHRLTVPHPRLAERRFVLEPLAAIAADVVHPTLGVTIRALLDRLPASV